MSGLARRAARRLLPMLLLCLAVPTAHGAEMTAERVRELAKAAAAERPLDLSGRDLSKLDLTGVDLSGARLAGADLHGTKLVDAKLRGADLSGARLDGVWLMRADFTDADLSGASLFGPVVYSAMEVVPGEEPTFAGVNFSGARVIAKLSRVDMRGAVFRGARLGVDMRNQSMGLIRADFSGSDLTDADFTHAELGRALLAFAKLRGAVFQGADLKGTDFSGAYLDGADFTGADLDDVILDGAQTAGAVGLPAAGEASR